MSLDPLLKAGWAIQAHVYTLVPCLLLGTWLIFFSRKGTLSHRLIGVAFLTLMVISATFTLFIHRRWPESPLLGLSIFHLEFVTLTYVSVWRALLGVRRKNLKMHRFWIGVLYWFLLIFVGLLNAFLFPGVTRDVVSPPWAEDIAHVLGRGW